MIDIGSEERRHRPGTEPGWRETWGFDFVAPDHDLAGWCELVLFADRAWYHAFVVGADRQLVAVVDHDVPLPAATLEIRTNGLWADHICETPVEHWTIGLEAFAVGLDDPAEMYGRQLGDQVPLGFDLEWECDSGREVVGVADGGYTLACTVSGEVLIGSAVFDLDATGTRHHHWGTAPPAVRPHPPDRPVAVTPLAVPDPSGGSNRRPRAVVADGDGWSWVMWTEPSPSSLHP